MGTNLSGITSLGAINYPRLFLIVDGITCNHTSCFFFSRLLGIFDIVELETERLTHVHSLFSVSLVAARGTLSCSQFADPRAKSQELGVWRYLYYYHAHGTFPRSVRCIMHMCD